MGPSLQRHLPYGGDMGCVAVVAKWVWVGGFRVVCDGGINMGLWCGFID